VPEVLGAVKRAVDTEPRSGRFIITGSVRGDVDSPTWPGTGRLLRIAMFGLTVGEIRTHLAIPSRLDALANDGAESLLVSRPEALDLRDYAELTLLGGFPEPVLRLPSSERRPWLESYIEQLLTRDVAAIADRRDPQLLRRYFEAHALNTAGTPDQETLRATAGVARATATAYEQLLRNLLVIDLVPAWWTNRLKRLIRTPKRYFIDPSLALAILRLDIAGVMKDADILGRVLDTFVAAQLRADIVRCSSSPRLFHLRQEQGRHEIDLIVEYGGGRIFGFEVKATSAPGRNETRHLAWLRDELGERFLGGAVLHTGQRAFMLEDKIVAAPISTLWT
jgi:predicted AAA+ superfamily ATPase